jgi:hypothetical protein
LALVEWGNPYKDSVIIDIKRCIGQVCTEPPLAFRIGGLFSQELLPLYGNWHRTRGCSYYGQGANAKNFFAYGVIGCTALPPEEASVLVSMKLVAR